MQVMQAVRNHKEIAVENLISVQEYIAWEFDFFQDALLSKRLRLGQAFLSEFETSEPNPILYYETSESKAREMIYRKYIKKD